MRSSATWAYHGGSRSWGDVGNNGKYLATWGTGAMDRGLMHYRSGLNMIPLIEWYRPTRVLVLRSVGGGGGVIVHVDGAASPQTGGSFLGSCPRCARQPTVSPRGLSVTR